MTAPGPAKKTILVVDDEPNIRKLVSNVLRKTPEYEVAVAEDGKAALEWLQANGFRCDLIITDIAVVQVTDRGLVLKEIVPGWTADEVQALSEPRLIVSPDLKEMELL